jgi:hypothetical protein
MIDAKCLGIGCNDKERWEEFYKNHENCQHYIGIKGDWDEKRIDVIGQNGNIGYD